MYLLLALLPLCSALSSSEVQKFQEYGRVRVTEGNNDYTFYSNSLPDHEMGEIQRNPNEASAQDFSMSFPQAPSQAAEASCLPMGAVGLAVNGVTLFNPYTILGTDAVVNEEFDDCDGHPDPQGTYHYHQIPDCVYKGGENELVGVALDGFPIYGPKVESGVELTSADLDRCHGSTRSGDYRYYMTRDFPYILGCFKGEVELTRRQLSNCKIADASTASTACLASLLAVLVSLLHLI